MAAKTFSFEVDGLYREKSEQMRKHAFKRVHDRQEAGDLTNESFCRLLSRGTLNGLENPAAYLMSILNNLISAALQMRGARIELPLNQRTDMGVPAAEGPADIHERRERSRLINESVEALRSSKDRCLIKQASLGRKPSQIADLEGTEGRALTSRQVSHVLSDAWPKLRQEFRQREIWPSVIPIGWFGRIRLRLSDSVHRVLSAVSVIDPACILAQAAIALCVVTLTGAGPSLAAAKDARVMRADTRQGCFFFPVFRTGP